MAAAVMSGLLYRQSESGAKTALRLSDSGSDCAPAPASPTILPCSSGRNIFGVSAGFPSVNMIPGDSATGPGLEVFWRPGCPYCSSLRRTLSRRHVPATWHNIWDDGSARDFVRSVNSGNETVPTVRIGAHVLTNPSWAQLDPLLGDGPWRSDPASARSGLAGVIKSWRSRP